jgi:hypothetical protein
MRSVGKAIKKSRDVVVLVDPVEESTASTIP